MELGLLSRHAVTAAVAMGVIGGGYAQCRAGDLRARDRKYADSAV